MKEALLVLAFAGHVGTPVRAGHLAQHIERWLFAAFRVRVVFDIDDALDKLRALGLVREAADIILSVAPPHRAVEILQVSYSFD